MKEIKPVALIGFMGSGKTTTGRMLANELDMPFADVDNIVEGSSGMRIPEILEAMGELGLRKLEALKLSGAAVNGGVVATSGGCVMLPQNREILKNNFTTIFLDTTFDIIYPRIVGTGRPVLHSLTINEMSRLLELRRPLYEECSVAKVDAGQDPMKVVEDMIDILM